MGALRLDYRVAIEVFETVSHNDGESIEVVHGEPVAGIHLGKFLSREAAERWANAVAKEVRAQSDRS